MRIRDPIHGTIVLTDAEATVVDTPHFQRLRHIRQLGFGELAFPGATHTRHAHCLGAMHVAARLFDAMTSKSGLDAETRERFRATVRLAVLCHDLGHMPLSHSSERIAPMRASLRLPPPLDEPVGRANHEDFTAKLLLDSSLTPIVRAAYAHIGVTAEQATALVMGAPELAAGAFFDRGVDWTFALRAIVSGELDADRMDYLLRDSLYTGVNYGRYDLEWLLQHISAERRLHTSVMAISPAAVFAFEDFLLSRFHMFLSVYYHHTAASFEYMLARFYDSSPSAFQIPTDPEAFLRCDDISLYAALRESTNPWAQRIVERRGFRHLVQFTERDPEYDLGALAAALEQAGIEHFTVESRGVLSKYFEEGNNPSLYVIDSGSGRLTPIAAYTPLYKRFGSVRLSRIYVRRDQAGLGQAILAREIGRPDCA